MPWSKIAQNDSRLDGQRPISFKDAIREAIDQAMVNDSRVFAIGLHLHNDVAVLDVDRKSLGHVRTLR